MFVPSVVPEDDTALVAGVRDFVGNRDERIDDVVIAFRAAVDTGRHLDHLNIADVALLAPADRETDAATVDVLDERLLATARAFDFNHLAAEHRAGDGKRLRDRIYLNLVAFYEFVHRVGEFGHLLSPHSVVWVLL